MTTFEAAVTGLGLVTPAGLGVAANWATLCAGRSTAREDPLLAGGSVGISCRVPDFDADVAFGPQRSRRLDPFIMFALVAAREAVAGAGLDPTTWDGARVAVVLGTSTGGMHTVQAQHAVHATRPRAVSPLFLPMFLPNMLAGQVSMEFAATGHSAVVSTACASGATAIGLARDLLERDRCDVVITGAGDASTSPSVMAGFDRMGALSRRCGDPAAASRPFDVDRDGLVAGEGAGILVLERLSDARARGATVRGRVIGYGASADAHHVTQPHPEGRGIEQAVREALADACAHPDAIGHVNTHGTSTPVGDLVEAQMLRRVLSDGPLCTSTKGVTGHLLGAAGAVEAIYTLLALEHGVVPPTANLEQQDPRVELHLATTPTPRRSEVALSSSFGFGGQNAVLVLAAA